jgi:hypothetical protein
MLPSTDPSSNKYLLGEKLSFPECRERLLVMESVQDKLNKRPKPIAAAQTCTSSDKEVPLVEVGFPKNYRIPKLINKTVCTAPPVKPVKIVKVLNNFVRERSTEREPTKKALKTKRVLKIVPMDFLFKKAVEKKKKTSVSETKLSVAQPSKRAKLSTSASPPKTSKLPITTSAAAEAAMPSTSGPQDESNKKEKEKEKRKEEKKKKEAKKRKKEKKNKKKNKEAEERRDFIS